MLPQTRRRNPFSSSRSTDIELTLRTSHISEQQTKNAHREGEELLVEQCGEGVEHADVEAEADE